MEPWYRRVGDYMLDAFNDVDTGFKESRADVREWASPVTDWMKDADADFMDGMRYTGPHLSPQIEGAMSIAPELLPSADIRDMAEGSATLADALGEGDYWKAAEGGGMMAAGLAATALPVSAAMFAGPGGKERQHRCSKACGRPEGHRRGCSQDLG